MTSTETSSTADEGMPGAPIRDRVPAGTYQVDPFHTQVTWRLNHMGFSMLEGQIAALGGSITIDPEHPVDGSVDIALAVSELTTTSAPFTEHLKSADFFDVGNHPEARFTSTGIRADRDHATIDGDLTIKGITRSVTLEADFVGAGANPRDGKLNFGFRAQARIRRSDFGLGMAVPVVADRVDLTINVAFIAA